MKQLIDFNLNSLLLLHWLFEEKSVSRAAERVGLSQPAASRSFQKLREVFSDELLIRTGRTYTLSKRAREIQPELALAFHHLNHATQVSSPFDPATSHDKISIAANDYVSIICTDAWAQHILPAAPQLRSVWRGLDLSIIELMASGEIDFVILPDVAASKLPNLSVLGDMVVKPLFDDEFTVFGHADHYTMQSENISIEDYIESEHILVSPSGKGPGLIDEHLQSFDLKRQIKHRVHSFGHAAELSLATNCLVVLPKRLALLYPRGRLRALPFKFKTMNVNIAWHASRTSDEKHKWIRRQFMDALLTT